MTRKVIALIVLSGGFMTALGCSIIPNIGGAFAGILGNLGLGGN